MTLSQKTDLPDNLNQLLRWEASCHQMRTATGCVRAHADISVLPN